MPPHVARYLSIAVFGAVWAFLAFGPLHAFVLLWAGLISWACFLHSGGDSKAMAKTIFGNAYGVFIGWIALLLILNDPFPSLGTLWPAIVVGLTMVCLGIVVSVDQLSVLPANVYGYAAILGYSLHQPLPAGNLITVSFANPFVLLVVSMLVGAVFGCVSAKVARALTKSPNPPTVRPVALPDHVLAWAVTA